jgi:hypothetical protein
MLAIMYHETAVQGYYEMRALNGGRLATRGLRRHHGVTPPSGACGEPQAGVYYVPFDETEA